MRHVIIAFSPRYVTRCINFRFQIRTESLSIITHFMAICLVFLEMLIWKLTLV